MKSIFEIKNSNIQFEESEYAGDIRALIVAQKFKREVENEEIIKSIRGRFSYYYKKTMMLQNIVLLLIVLFFIWQKPNWCNKLGDEMNQDCNSDVSGEVQYYLINTFFVNPRVGFIICFGLMYFLLVMQVMKVQYSDPVKSIETVKMYLMLTIFSISLIVTMFETFNFVEKTDINNLFKMMFVMSNLKEVIRNIIRIVKLLAKSYSVFFLLVITLYILSIIARVMFEGVEIGQDGHLYVYSFTNFWRTFESMFFSLMMINFPDVLMDAYKINTVYAIFFIFVVIVGQVIIGSLVGGFFFHFNSFYIENINEVATNYPYFEDEIKPLVDAKFLDSEQMNRIIKLLVKKKSDIGVEKDELKRQEIIQKFQKAVNKIIAIQKFGKSSNIDDLQNFYSTLKNNFFYKLLVLSLSIYMILIPAFILDRQNLTIVVDYFQMQELLALLFMIDFYFIYKFEHDSEFWNTPNICEFISNIGILIFSNLLSLLKTDFRDHEAFGNFNIFLIWSSLIYLKFFKIHKIMMGYIDYKIIVRTCLDVFPIVADMFKIYLVLILFYGTCGLFMFGGILNTNFLETFEEITGDELDEEQLLYNCNDLLNSIIFFLSGNFIDFFNIANIGYIISISKNPNSYKPLITKIFFYSFFFISEFILLNVIVGFICEIIAIYQGNNSDIKEEETEIQRNQTIIDVLLDKIRMDGDIRSDDEEEDNKNKPEDEKEQSEVVESNEDDSLLKDLSENSIEIV